MSSFHTHIRGYSPFKFKFKINEVTKKSSFLKSKYKTALINDNYSSY